jgi:hypothetical protein
MVPLRGMARSAWIVAVLLLLAAPTTADSPDDPLAEALAKADKRFIGKLNSLNKWAAGKRISGFRHRVYGLILRVDPDDRRARGVLKYRRKGEEEAWVQAEDYKRPVDFAKGTLLKAEDRLQAVLENYRDAVLEALGSYGAVGTQRADDEVDRLLEFLPQDPQLHKRRGDVKHDGRWMMPETVIAERERKHLALIVHDSRKEAGDGVRKLDKDVVKRLPMGWKSDKRVIMGMVPSAHGKQCLIAMECADRFCDRVFGTTKRLRGPATSIILDTLETARAFLKGDPKWSKAASQVDRVGAVYLPDGTYVTWDATADSLSASGTRQVVDGALEARFRGHERGWITEGIGQRVTWHLLGRHGPGFVSLASTEMHQTAGDGERLPREAAQWNRVAAAVLRRDGPKRLAAVLTKRLNAMQASDVLVAYGLAAFLMETRPKEFLAFTAASAERHDVDAFVKETLGADDVAMLCRVLRRWLKEN